MDETATMDPGIIKGLFEQGLMGVEIPEEYGGTGMNFMAACLVIEELAKVDASVSVMCDVQNTLVNNVFTVMLETKAGLTTVESRLVCASFTLMMKSRAEYTHAWLLGEAGLFLVMANVDPSKGYKGITCFLAERDFEGLEVGKKEDKLGIRASSTCPITFTDMKVPKENIVGEIGKGYKIAIEILNEGRIGIASQMLGIAEGCMEATLPYLWQRKQFNNYIGDFQGMQHQVAQIAMEIEAAKNMVYNAARLKETGQPFVKEAAMAKLYASRVAERTASHCIEWMGGVGFVKEFPQEKFYRDCKIGAIYEGTSLIQLTTIAKLLRAEHQ
ncbi:ACADSB [Symbiodinium sp. KB8]|nr:ACADSB [Symbiodinium sp. KB8]